MYHSLHFTGKCEVGQITVGIFIFFKDPPFYTARSAGQKGCVNMLRLSSSSSEMGAMPNGPIRAKQVNQSSSVIG